MNNQEIFLLSSYDYELPERLIAQNPAQKRDMSRLFVLDRKTGEYSHRHFCDIVDYLRPGDALVINDSKVIPARLYGNRFKKSESGELTDEKGSTVETLLLERKTD